MATLIQSYEQQYSVLTADITAKIGRLKLGNDGKCLAPIKDLIKKPIYDFTVPTITLNICVVFSDNRDQLTKEINANFEEANDLVSYPNFNVYLHTYFN